MKVKSVRKVSHPRRRIKIGGKSGSIVSRISSFKPKSLISIGGKRRYRKHRKVSGGKSRKSYRKVKSGGKRSKKSYKKTKSGGRRRTKRSKSKRT